MRSLTGLYRRLPRSVKPIAERSHGLLQRLRTPRREREAFRERFFGEGEYERYRDEFDASRIRRLRDEAVETFRDAGAEGGFGDVRDAVARDLFCLVRAIGPETVVETGVCNGYSSLVLLEAMDRNDRGRLVSVDYPYRSGESLSSFRRETFEGYGGAALPRDEEPGWIVPDDLRSRWTLRVGRSQDVLPELYTEIGGIDLFLHDSEHSLPCMLFEFELAWNWLDEDGVLVADDVSWNEAFEAFVEARDADHGYLGPDVGYCVR